MMPGVLCYCLMLTYAAVIRPIVLSVLAGCTGRQEGTSQCSGKEEA